MIQQKHNFISNPWNWLLQQFQLKPGKPSITAGFQALIAVLVPLGVGVLLGHPAASAIAILGAWFVGLVNVEGIYRQQATAKITAAISITGMLLIANLVHNIPWLSLLTTFVVMFLTGFIGLFGQAAASISLITSITFIVAQAKFAAFPDWTTILEQCTFCLAGGIWSIVVSLGIWRLNPYKPVIQTVANCYETLSQLVDAGKGRVAYPGDRRAQLIRFLTAQDNFNQALSTARRYWSAAWTAQRSANPSGNQLLILIEDTVSMANSIVILMEQVVISSHHSLFESFQQDILEGMKQLALALHNLSAIISNGKSSVYFINLEDLDQSVEALCNHQKTLARQLEQGILTLQIEDNIAFSSISKISSTLKQLAEQIHSDLDMIITLQKSNLSRTVQKKNPKKSFSKIVSLTVPTVSSLLELSHNNWTIHSTFFRHALRLAVIAMIAEVIASLFKIPTGYWITLTAVIALKPNYGGTSQTAFQRVLGTVLGGFIGIAIVTLIYSTWVIVACLLLLIVIAVAVRPLSFSLFSMLLTPAIILLLNVTSQGGWQIGILRIADSLGGGLLALLGSYLLFPYWERQRLPTHLEKTIQANLDFFHEVIAAYLSPEIKREDEISRLRRLAALENTNLSAAAQRLFSEPQHIQGDVEPITTLVFYIRRFFNSVTALAEHQQTLNNAFQCLDFKQFTDSVIWSLENEVAALKHHQLPQPLPDLDQNLESINEYISKLYTRSFVDSSHLYPSKNSSQVIQDRTSVSTGLNQIAYEIKNIHGAIVRLQT
jgi:uncharacterized membrane protein YccC